jgi:hypothetical protein
MDTHLGFFAETGTANWLTGQVAIYLQICSARSFW